VRRIKGTWTCNCVAAAAVSGAGGAAPDLLAEGSKRYSISVKRPSGGTKESVLDWEKRFSLCLHAVWSEKCAILFFNRCEPDAGVEGRLGDGMCVGERQEEVGCSWTLRVSRVGYGSKI
jgi:hypothetical protein